MEGKITFMYPQVIFYAVIATIAVLLLSKHRKSEYKKGVIVANTKYLKSTKYFKYLNTKYYLISSLIKITCILLILATAILTARMHSTKKYTNEYNNRDIMLCLDFSPSMIVENYEILEAMEKTVSSLKEERFGITIFDSTANMVVPLTTDYNYIIYSLNDLKSKFYKMYLVDVTNEKPDLEIGSSSYMFNYKDEAYRRGINRFDGSSRISDSLATCASNFNDDDRTKVIFFSTDNLGVGVIMTMEEVIDYCKEKNIKVYPIGARRIEDNASFFGFTNPRGKLVDLADATGGKYFDFTKYSIDEITDEIETLNSSALLKTTYVAKNDYPEKILPYMLGLMIFLFVLDWRVKI